MEFIGCQQLKFDHKVLFTKVTGCHGGVRPPGVWLFEDQLPAGLLKRIGGVTTLFIVPELSTKSLALLVGKLGQILLNLVHGERTEIELVFDQVLLVALLSLVEF